MAINQTSFTNTPQAGNDVYNYSEDQILGLANYNNTNSVLTLDVMGNDLGGNAKTLYSVDDGNGNPLTADFELLIKDVNANGVSGWEKTEQQNWVRINNGKIEFALGAVTDGVAGPSGTSINTLAGNEVVHDSFVYAIRLGNGTLSQARVTVNILGQNDGPVIGAETLTGQVTEKIIPTGTLVTTGNIAFTDADLADTHTATVVTSTAGALGQLTASISGDTTGTGKGGVVTWNYSVNASAVEYLAAGETKVEHFTVVLSDGRGGTVERTVTVNVIGTNDAPVLSGTQATLASGTEDTAYTVKASDLLQGFSDVDGDKLSVADLKSSNGTVVDNGDGTYTMTPAANYNGKVTLSYSVTDSNGSTVAASQQFNLAAVNDAVTGSATAVLAAGTEDTAYTVTAAQLLQGFSDVDVATNGQVLSVSGAVTADHGTVADN
ncbi:cadherin-like domain-containing protein, partial [Noviherbaspirillum soli]|uniref:cadherin-like domain-containing protein n=1 Tax=Noviherbaspirillum soli TaxID=1064518 RepID=UPI001889F5E1